MQDKCLGITIKGRVQGVGFRYQTENAAKKFGIKGYVKNIPDGSVYIEACGQKRNLELFLEWCKNGPAVARVTVISVSDLPYRSFEDFNIKY